MYRIGDFSIISQVSIKMLRHYDELGLLKPAEIDRFTSYRYYSLDQLPHLNRIMALKAMGFSLIEIRDLLETTPSLDVLRAQAAAKETELTQHLETLREKMAHLKTWMHRIEIENMMPEYEIVLKPLSPAIDPPLPSLTAEKVSVPLPTRAGLDSDILLRSDALPQADALACTLLLRILFRRTSRLTSGSRRTVIRSSGRRASCAFRRRRRRPVC